MIKKEYTRQARRARNYVWNAAGRYDFEPPFLAFFPDGEADYYFDMMVGLAEKWYDLSRLWTFFAAYEGDRRAEEFDAYLWLGLENALYEKEVRERPFLELLRRERAELFFQKEQTMTRQQMEYQSMAVYTQQQARWSGVCGRRSPLMSGREKRIAQALLFSATGDTEGILAEMAAFLREFFRFEMPEAGQTTGRRPLKIFRKREHKRKDSLIIRTGTGEGDHARALQQAHGGLGRFMPPDQEDEEYIRAVCGESLITEGERRIIEEELCVKEDAGLRLWVCRSGTGQPSTKEGARAAEEARYQRERNEAFLKAHAAESRGHIKKLSAQLDTIFSSYLKHLPESARRGRLQAEKAYRLPLLQDDRVFLKNGDDLETDVCVDLLLDASQSRLNSQELLAAEAYILAVSLEKSDIPVRVSAFRSLRNHTVIEILKPWEQADCMGLMHFYSGGWNRDGLAFKTLGRLNDDGVMAGKKRMILILTDGSPNDSAPLIQDGKRREYEGSPAVKLAEEAVSSLRQKGIQVGAVFHGNTHNLENVSRIFGHNYIRIRSASQLAQGIGDLFLMLLREGDKD